MSNEQRAHDFAIMLTNFYLNNPENISDNSDFSINFSDGLIDNPYNLYKKIYNTVAKYINDDFKD